MNEALSLLVNRLDAAIGEMLIVAEVRKICALWIGQTMRSAGAEFCAFSTGKLVCA